MSETTNECELAPQTASPSTGTRFHGTEQSESIGPQPEPDLFWVKDFFDAEFCKRLIEEMHAGDSKKATVNWGGESVLDTTMRDVETIKIKRKTWVMVFGWLLALKPALESHFGVTLTECHYPAFLRYTEGGFYVPHKDSFASVGDPEYPLARKVSVVVFLNHRARPGEPGDYSGGELMMYGSEEKCDWEQHSRPVRGEAGSLVAFRSDVLHSVEPVTAGERFTIAAWFV